MVDCDPTHPLNQVKWEPWVSKKKRKRRARHKRENMPRLEKERLLCARQNGEKTPEISRGINVASMTRLQRTHALWARQNDLSLDRVTASAALDLQSPDTRGSTEAPCQI